MKIIRKNNETSANVIRRFTRKIRQSGNLIKARSLRYATRPKSAFLKKKEALKKIKKANLRQRLWKLGKLEIKK